jgi:predicted RNA-binding protein with PUA-like domain
VRALEPLPRPVTLADVKANPRLAAMALVKTSRLSVQPVTDAEWAEVCRMAGVSTPKRAKKAT